MICKWSDNIDFRLVVRLIWEIIAYSGLLFNGVPAQKIAQYGVRVKEAFGYSVVQTYINSM